MPWTAPSVSGLPTIPLIFLGNKPKLPAALDFQDSRDPGESTAELQNRRTGAEGSIWEKSWNQRASETGAQADEADCSSPGSPSPQQPLLSGGVFSTERFHTLTVGRRCFTANSLQTPSLLQQQPDEIKHPHHGLHVTTFQALCYSFCLFSLI